MDDVGHAAFTEDQRQAAFTILDVHEAKTVNRSYQSPEPAPGEAGKKITCQGRVSLVIINNSEGGPMIRFYGYPVSQIFR